ncbi:MAG: carbohydrate ABC transporter permease [Nocardioides sp.]|uniref:carbohydrate ABC transporter permease n=1 Tax=Nocardioides nematodiphilus TaxID=2849669 RepID=UPI001CD98FC9|nr:sugar ABC transporter permease [Nocardioides nematodiphilus]MCA1982267.1 sugar ABC transporter permease [Nocardioides nematodiphilus]
MSSPAATSVAAGEPVAAAETPRRPRKRRGPGAVTRPGLTPLLLLSPAGLVITALTIVPIGYLIYLSFTNAGQKMLFTGTYDIVGLRQYRDILHDREFWRSFVRTILFTAAMVAGSVVVGMGVAQLLGKIGTGFRYAVTVVLIFAWAMPNVASSMVWGWLFQPGYGVANWLLTQTHLFGDVTATNWANSPRLAYACIWMLIVWQAVPFIALTLNAAQTQVDPAYYEAARLDGASEWRVYWTITLHFLRPTLLLITILSVIWDFNVFNQIWLISNGGPNGATSTLGIYAYRNAFVSFHFGVGAAISVVTTLLLLVLTAFYIRSLIKAGEDL